MDYLGLAAWSAGANLLLLIGLLIVYVHNLARTRSSFTLGLVLFAVLLFVQNAVSFYFLITMMPYYALGVEGYVFLLSVLQTLSLVVLEWTTWT